MLGYIHKLDSVRPIAQERGATRLRAQDARLAFHAQIVGHAAALGDQAHQAFRLMGIQLIRYEHPHRLGIAVDGLGDMGGEIRFGAARADAGGNHLPSDNIKIHDWAERAVPFVFKLAAFGATLTHRLGRSDAFKRLNPGHLVTAQDMAAQRVQEWCIGVQGTDGLDLLGKREWVNRFGLGVQPVARAMGVQIGFALKNARLNGLKSWTQSLV